MSTPTIGVLALQGDVREHVDALERLDARTLRVRRVEELERCDGLVLPGGESTTMIKLASVFGIRDALREAITGGLPTFGTCAGMIMLADRLRDGAAGQETFGGLDVTVRRNAFGRQVDSFEADLDFAMFDEPVHAVFIRAPWIEQAGPDVDVLATVVVDDPAASHPPTDRIVAVQQGPLLATSFHPEVGGDDRVHRLFVAMVTGVPAGEAGREARDGK